MLLQDLERKSLITPPSFLACNTHYLCRMGSVAYGVSTDNSDLDLYGVCIPPRDYIFPPDYIDGFDNRDLTFHQWQKHHVIDKSANGGKGCSYDFSIYSIVNYFKLAMDNNPNVIDSLFVRREHILHITRIWEIVRENRQLFLHKGIAHKLKSYAFSQLAKAKNCIKSLEPIYRFEDEYNIDNKTTYEQALNQEYVSNCDIHDHKKYLALWEEGIKKTSRFEAQKLAGFDRKFCYHIYRLTDQAEYILNYGDLDLQEPGRVAKMKAIRRGDVTFESIVHDFETAEKRLTELFHSSKLRMYPDTKAIRKLLITCLEDHYGSLKAFLREHNPHEEAIKEIRAVFGKYNL